MKTKSTLVISLVVALSFLLSACVKQPTSSEKIVDDRPAISFKSQSGALDGAYVVFVDNLRVGTASQYPAGRAALRVLSGSHLLRVERGGEVVLEQEVYLGDGAVREILIP